MTDRPPTQLEALRAALVACGFLLSGECGPDRIGLAETPEGIEACLQLDYPEEPVEAPCSLAQLMAGVALRVRGPQSVADLKRAKHKLMMNLYRAGLWVGDEPPPEDWRDVLLIGQHLDDADAESEL